MSLEEMIITLYKTNDKDFQEEFSTRMNPIEYQNALNKFRYIQDELFSFLYSLKPIVTEKSDPLLIELIDEMDKFLEEEGDV